MESSWRSVHKNFRALSPWPASRGFCVVKPLLQFLRWLIFRCRLGNPGSLAILLGIGVVEYQIVTGGSWCSMVAVSSAA